MNPHRLRQIAAVARYETSKNLLSLRAAPLLLLAGLPILAVLMLMIASLMFGKPNELDTLGGTAVFYAHIFQFILRFVIYAGCVWIFMNLFRGEVLERSLHYYFLAPIRREVLIVGKFIAGWITATLLFVGSTVISMFLFFSIRNPVEAVQYLLFGPGAAQLWSYISVAILGCLGYGAVFLLIGLFLRNPIVPALLFWALEWLNPFLPALLKKISVVFYLQSMLPVKLSQGPFAVLADPTPVWLAVPGLLTFAALTLLAAGLRIRRMEIAYGLE